MSGPKKTTPSVHPCITEFTLTSRFSFRLLSILGEKFAFAVDSTTPKYIAAKPSRQGAFFLLVSILYNQSTPEATLGPVRGGRVCSETPSRNGKQTYSQLETGLTVTSPGLVIWLWPLAIRVPGCKTIAPKPGASSCSYRKEQIIIIYILHLINMCMLYIIYQ